MTNDKVKIAAKILNFLSGKNWYRLPLLLLVAGGIASVFIFYKGKGGVTKQAYETCQEQNKNLISVMEKTLEMMGGKTAFVPDEIQPTFAIYLDTIPKKKKRLTRIDSLKVRDSVVKKLLQETINKYKQNNFYKQKQSL